MKQNKHKQKAKKERKSNNKLKSKFGNTRPRRGEVASASTPKRPTGDRSPLSAFLALLETRAGERLKRKKLIADLQSRVHAGGRGRIGREAPDPTVVVAELELLGLLREEGADLIVADPFVLKGRVSISPRGAAFVAIRGADPLVRDVFVAPDDVRGALPGDAVELRLRDRRRDRFSGTVVRVLERARSEYRLQLLADPRRGFAEARILDMPVPLSATLSVERLPADMRSRLRADAVVIARLSGRRLNHLGVYGLEADFLRFEDDTDLDRDYARILMKYNLDPVYPPEIELPDPAEPPAEREGEAWSRRRDLRELETITIDGADSKDFDDALSLEHLDGDNWKLYVHIADVALYVEPGSPLDQEALRRATSVYLTDRVVPMLPPVLSENLCSLVAGVDRPAFTAEMIVSGKNGRISSPRFYRSIIRVDRRWTYDQAEEEIDRQKDVAPGSRSLIGRLWPIAQRQRARRMNEGRVDLDLPEPVLETDGNSNPVGYRIRARLRSSMLIEECMLSANIVVAEFLRKSKMPVLHRVHEPMEEEKLERLNFFFEIYNIDCELKDPSYAEIQKAQAAVARHPERERVERIFNMLLLRSFMQAKYQGDPVGHWGLGFEDYTHFTSPIRRYPDLIVHRVLARALARKRPIYSAAEIEELGRHTSERERHAMEAERDMSRLKLIRLVERQGRTSFRGFLTGFRPDRVFVQLEDPPVEGIITKDHLTNDFELILPNDFSVYVKRLSRPAFLGESWGLELDRADAEGMTLYFRPDWSRVDKPFG